LGITSFTNLAVHFLTAGMDNTIDEEIIDGAIELLTIIKEKITDTSDISRTRFNSTSEFRMQLSTYMYQVKHGDINSFRDISHEFAPNASLPEHATANGWASEFKVLAKRFDQLYKEALK
jgi:hypothetical protein